jgi:hypothetical protein
MTFTYGVTSLCTRQYPGMQMPMAPALDLRAALGNHGALSCLGGRDTKIVAHVRHFF